MRRFGTATALAILAMLYVMAIAVSPRTSPADAVPAWRLAFTDPFDGARLIKEASAATRSADPAWWVESGGGMQLSEGLAGTMQGVAPAGYFRSRYALRNPVDSDGGRHPQNLFRLLTKKSVSGDSAQQCYFRILEYNLSDSPQRYDPNGLLLFSRYAGPNDLYYAGVRVDGHAIVKKKSGGTYYTLAEKAVWPGTYDRKANPILLPKGRWIGLRTVTEDRPDGSVTVSLYADELRTGEWKLLVSGTDAGVGGRPLRAGRTGIRTDFMDVQFDDYAVAVR